MFQTDLDTVDTLRRDAVNVREPHPSGIKKLQAYAGQLVWIGGKFPIDVGRYFEISLSFDWDYMANTIGIGRLELSSPGIPPWGTIPNDQ